MISKGAGLAALTAIAASGAAYGNVTISSAATQNMSCTAGVCTPTATKAVLNVGDLEAMLASGNATVTTTGNGVQANDISVNAPVSWTNGSALTLDAFRSLTVNKAISVQGVAGLTVVTNDGGKKGLLGFRRRGNVTFTNLSSLLAINGTSYTLVNTVASLASAVAKNPSGAYAFASNYDASQDGTYSTPPVSTIFSGTFEGLGNIISHLTIDVPKMYGASAGLFGSVQTGQLRDIGVEHANVKVQGIVSTAGALVARIVDGVVSGSHSSGLVHGKGEVTSVGGLIGANSSHGVIVGYIINSFSTATVISNGVGSSFTGGLVGYSAGGQVKIENSYATGSVTAGKSSYVGGLVGIASSIANSFANGPVTVGDWDGGSPPASAGGLVGYYYDADGSPIENSYSTGNVFGGQNTYVGGLIGLGWKASFEYCYSTGAPTGGTGSYVGGLVGFDYSAGFLDTYWDTDTSGITNLSQGAGNISNVAGITGLTTEELQSGLPEGFESKIWAENPNINNGLPYLIKNAPPK